MVMAAEYHANSSAKYRPELYRRGKKYLVVRWMGRTRKKSP